MVSFHGVRLYTSNVLRPHGSQALPFQTKARCLASGQHLQLPLALLTSSVNTLALPGPLLAGCEFCPPLVLRYTPSFSTLAQTTWGSRGHRTRQQALSCRSFIAPTAPPLLVLNSPLLTEPA